MAKFCKINAFMTHHAENGCNWNFICDRNYVVENVGIVRALTIIDISWSSIVVIVTSLWAGRSGVQINMEILLFSERSTLALGPTQPALKWVALFLP